MGLFDRHKDPIEEQRRELERELQRVRKQIRRLETHGDQQASRSPLPENRPLGEPIQRRRRPAPPPTPANDPIFEEVPEQETTPVSVAEGVNPGPAAESRELYNHAGLRKYDLAGLFRRIRAAALGASENDKKLINYLAAGSIHGLRPLRHEKRVARNRALVAAGALIVVLWFVIYQIFNSAS